jgi:hypothetical protein
MDDNKLLQNNLAEATTEQGFPTKTGLPVQREVELEDGTKVIVESVVPEVMAQTLKSHFVTPGEKYVDNGKDLNGVVQNYNEEEPAPVEPKLVKIEVTTEPTKVDYTEGDEFNPEGMVVTATYDNDSEEVVTDYTYEPTIALTTEDTEITITYEDKITTQAITVVAKNPDNNELGE